MVWVLPHSSLGCLLTAGGLLCAVVCADKHERMQAVVKYYIGGDEHALDKFPGGSEKGT
jgi:hypothetical protein